MTDSPTRIREDNSYPHVHTLNAREVAEFYKWDKPAVSDLTADLVFGTEETKISGKRRELTLCMDGKLMENKAQPHKRLKLPH
jgi:hypothetical protein